MSKLQFRARAVDTSKQMPVFLAEELPDLSEYASINRAVPQMPTGMEKEEEMELHLQQAISAQQRVTTGVAVNSENAIIPIPKVTSDVKYYERLYPSDYKLPKQLIKVQAALNLEPEIPDYDLDSEDERWLSSNGQKMEVSPIQFERIMDTLEKQSEFKVITTTEAKLLLQEDDDMLLAVYDYWLSKRLVAASQGKHLIPRVKTEKRDGTGAKHNPYVAFRRRAEKMQTRKNRRNDEESYEKILKLRHDLQKAVTLAEMVKRREKSKREMINLTLDIADKRFVLEDFRDELFSLICNEAKPSFRFSKQEMGPTSINANSNNKKPTLASVAAQMATAITPTSTPVAKKRRLTGATTLSSTTATMKDDKGLVSREWLLQNAEEWNRPPASFLQSPKATATTSESVSSCRLDRELDESEGRYAFKRRRGCRYYAPLTSSPSSNQHESETPFWPWEQAHDRVRYFPTYLTSRYNSNSNGMMNGLRFVGLARRRAGRGGRILLDRCWSPPKNDHEYSDNCGDLPSTSAETVIHRHASNYSDRKEGIYFRPVSPLLQSELDEDDAEMGSTSSAIPSPSPAAVNKNSSSSIVVGSRGVPFATVVGPRGILRLPLTVGTLIPAPEEPPQILPSSSLPPAYRNSPISSSKQSRNSSTSSSGDNSSLLQKQLAATIETMARGGGSTNGILERQSGNGDAQQAQKVAGRNRKRSSNVVTTLNSTTTPSSQPSTGNSTVFIQPATPDSSTMTAAQPTMVAYSTRNDNSTTISMTATSSNNNSKSTAMIVDGNNGAQSQQQQQQWRKQNDFGATTALLMRPPVRLPINSTTMTNQQQIFDSNSTRPSPQQQHQQRETIRTNRPTQVHGIAATPTTMVPTTSNSNYSLVNASPFAKGGQDLLVGSGGNNGKFGLGVVAAAAAANNNNTKAGSPHPPTSAHTYALPPAADYFSRQNSVPNQQSSQVQTLTRTASGSSSLMSMAVDAQQQSSSFESGGQSGQQLDHHHHPLLNGPTVDRSPRRRPYGGAMGRTAHPAAIQQAVVMSGGGGGSIGGGNIVGLNKLGAQQQQQQQSSSSSSVAPPPPANLPLDHGSYHASGFAPPPVVAVISAPSISSVGTPVASAAPAVVSSMVNGGGGKDEHHQPCTAESAAITAQYNGQRVYREHSSAVSPSSSTGVVELSHPLPTPSPSPNARFLNITDAGSLIAPKFEDMHVKSSSVSSVVMGRLTPTTMAIGKNRKSSDD